MSIGANVKSRRINKGVSQEVLAEKLHISQATLSNIEADKSVPDIILLQHIAAALDTNINELLDSKTNFDNNENAGYIELVNQLHDKLIELYEKRLTEKDVLIEQLKKRLKKK